MAKVREVLAVALAHAVASESVLTWDFLLEAALAGVTVPSNARSLVNRSLLEAVPGKLAAEDSLRQGGECELPDFGYYAEVAMVFRWARAQEALNGAYNAICEACPHDRKGIEQALHNDYY